MGQIFDADEARNEYLTKMGQELGVRFHALRHKYWEAVWCWQQFNELFGENDKRIDLLNRKAPLFFLLVQSALIDQMLLSITRLAEPPGSGERRNLTVRSLLELVDDTTLRDEIQRQCTALDDKIKFAVSVRNKRIAHHDQATALRQLVTPLPAVTRQRIAAALGAIGGVLAAIERHYAGHEVLDRVYDMADGALALVYALRGDAGWDAIAEQAIAENRYNPMEWEKFLPEI